MEHSFTYLAGRTIEKKIANALQKRYGVLLTSDYKTYSKRQGPSLAVAGGGIVLPDLQTFGLEYPGGAWIDVKAKEKANLHHNWKRLEHGFERRNFGHYESIKAFTKLPCFIFVPELSTGEILAAEIDTLKASGVVRNGTWDNTGTPSINFDRSAFEVIGTFVVGEDDLSKLQISLDWPKADDIMKGYGILPSHQLSLF